jgi:hypothetical protein
MIITKEIPIMTKVLEKIICDSCKKEFIDDMELQEFTTLTHTAGYGSIFGDENVLELDLCQYCLKDLLGNYIIVHKPEQVIYD